jgi:hypothetical protein
MYGNARSDAVTRRIMSIGGYRCRSQSDGRAGINR